MQEKATIEDCLVCLSNSWGHLNSQANYSQPDAFAECDTPAKRKKTSEKSSEMAEKDSISAACAKHSFMQYAVAVEKTTMNSLFAELSLPTKYTGKLEVVPELQSKDNKEDRSTQQTEHITLEYFTKCATHPKVIELICKVMKENPP